MFLHCLSHNLLVSLRRTIANPPADEENGNSLDEDAIPVETSTGRTRHRHFNRRRFEKNHLEVPEGLTLHVPRNMQCPGRTGPEDEKMCTARPAPFLLTRGAGYVSLCEKWAVFWERKLRGRPTCADAAGHCDHMPRKDSARRRSWRILLYSVSPASLLQDI